MLFLNAFFLFIFILNNSSFYLFSAGYDLGAGAAADYYQGPDETEFESDIAAQGAETKHPSELPCVCECGQKISNGRNLSRHKRSQDHFKKLAQQHNKTHENEAPKKQLTQLYAKPASKEKIACEICGESVLICNIHRHRQSCKESYLCGHCHESFSSKQILTKHLQKPHYEQPISKCERCYKPFYIDHGGILHGKKCLEPYLCGTCGKSFRNTTSFQSHMLSLTDHRSFFVLYSNIEIKNIKPRELQAKKFNGGQFTQEEANARYLFEKAFLQADSSAGFSVNKYSKEQDFNKFLLNQSINKILFYNPFDDDDDESKTALGLLIYSQNKDEFPTYCIDWMCVHPKFQRAKIGSAILAYLEKNAVGTITAIATKESLDFYLKNQFEIIDEENPFHLIKSYISTKKIATQALLGLAAGAAIHQDPTVMQIPLTAGLPATT